MSSSLPSSFRARRRREWATVAFGLLSAAALLIWSRTAHSPPPPSGPVVLSMSVSDEGGVLASPVVMSEPGQKVEVRLVCEDNPLVERIHLTLDPMGVQDGQLLYSYELSVKGHVDEERGTVKLAMGGERKIRIHPAREHGVTLTVYAETLGKYLQRRHLRPAPRPIAS